MSDERLQQIEQNFDAACQDSYGDEWMRAHKGALRALVGRVWYCGDDYCDCSEPVIEAVFDNSRVTGVVRVALWVGDFRTDGDEGAMDDLLAVKTEIERADPPFARRIEWVL